MGHKSAPARPVGMRVTAGMREVVRTRLTLADAATRIAPRSAQTRDQADDEQPPSGTAASRLYTAQLPFSSANGSLGHLPLPAISPAAAGRPVTQSPWQWRCSASAAAQEGQESKLEKLT